ncbi:MAG: Bax inhibitor-1/YccA family protein [Alphaproteobacteria bacterium]
MSNDRYQDFVRSDASVGQAIDEGLRKYMLGVYNYMTTGLLITAFVSYLIIETNAISMFYTQTANGGYGLSFLGIAALIAPFACVFYLSYAIRNSSLQKVQIAFFAFSALMGLSIAPVLALYTGASVARVFLITSGTFAGMSLLGYTTKKDLTGLGSFLYMGLWGIILASIVNIFMRSSGLDFAVSVLGVLIFVGLTAYDTQKIRRIYYSGDNYDMSTRKSISGALELYMDFINMFLYLLRFFGNRK